MGEMLSRLSLRRRQRFWCRLLSSSGGAWFRVSTNRDSDNKNMSGNVNRTRRRAAASSRLVLASGLLAIAAANANASSLRGVPLRAPDSDEAHGHLSYPMGDTDGGGDVRRRLKTVQNYCGETWGDANGSCSVPCPTGEAHRCPSGQQCFADLTSCPPMEVAEKLPDQPSSLSQNFIEINNNGGGAGGSTYGYGHFPFQKDAPVPSYCPPTTNTVNVGYYQSWAKYRDPSCHPQRANQIDVDAFGYTHLIYSFAGISAGGELIPYNGIMEEVTLYDEFNTLKIGHDVKTLIAVGGWNLDQSLFGKVASSHGRRTKFAESVVEFLRKYNFDGLDLDWEYPVTRQGKPEDYENYPLLVKAIKDAFEASGRDYLLTMAIPINPEKLDKGFNMASLSRSVDWFHLMSYDIYGSWGDVAGSNTDLRYIMETVEKSILSRGVSGEQLVLGLASYGRSMVLRDPTCATAGCPIAGAGMQGCSGEAGFSPLFELMEKHVRTGNYDSLLLNPTTGSMEMVLQGNIFVSLDVVDTFEMKRDYYLSECFLGQMWWAVDMIKDPVFGAAPQPAVPGPVSTPDRSPAAPSPAVASGQNAPGVNNDDKYCEGNDGPGLVAIEDCKGFVFCQGDRMDGTVTMCSPGLVFDANMEVCNWPSKTNVCGYEFCPDKMTGHVPFEECTKFYYCKHGKIDGDIDSCPDGTLFDVGSGICNWASEVECLTSRPTSRPTTPMPVTPRPSFATVTPPAVESKPADPTPRPTYAVVGGGNVETTTAASSANIAFASVEEEASLESHSSELRFSPSDDAYVQESLPYENYNDRFIVVDENRRYDGLVRFYVQGIEDRQVNYVKLRLFAYNGSRFGGNFYKSNANWHEDTVTWDTVPSILNSRPLATVKTVLVDDWIEVDVTGLLDRDGPVSIRITSSDPDNVMYSSKENPDGNAPQLIVGVEPNDVDAQSTVMNTFKIGPTDDAYVMKTNPDDSFGDDTILEVDMSNGFKKTYLRFDFSRVHIASLEKAILRLYGMKDSSSGGTFLTVSNSQWDEKSITFANSPPPDGQFLGTLGQIKQGNWYEIDITNAVTSKSPLTICILGIHVDSVSYASKESDHSPEVLLTLSEMMPILSRGGHVTELVATDDATIVLKAPDMNLGDEETLIADLDDGMHNFLIKFDASDIPRGLVKNAKLLVYALNEEPAFGGTFVEVKNNAWSEQSVTWNNAPSSDGMVLGSLMEAEHGSWHELDVTNAVVGGSEVSFRVSSPHYLSAVYASRSSNHPPKLVVQYSPPDPIPDGFEVFGASDATSILMDKSTRNFGRDKALRLDGHGGVYNSLLRFDLTSVEKGTVQEAILRLYAIDGSPSGGTLVVTSNTNWEQNRVSWFTAPRADGEVIVTLGPVTPYRWYQIDLSKIISELGGGPLSIRLTPSHGNRCAYASNLDPHGNKPQLLIKSDMFAGIQRLL